ncbi:hypothetical protein AB0L25_35590, partial [Spirillospora sp. NPDC052242]
MDIFPPGPAAAPVLSHVWHLADPSPDGALRVAAFVSLAAVAGCALVRPFAAAHPRTVPVIAAVAVPCALMSVDPPLAAFGVAALALAAAAQRRPRAACGLGAALTVLRRGRLHGRARREPARVQLAAGGAGVRGPDRR